MWKSDKNRHKYQVSSIKTNSLADKYLHYLILAGIVILTFTVYSDTFKNNFISWDDPTLVVTNNDIQSISIENIRKMFTNSYVYMYVPLTVLSFALEYKFFGLNPLHYHIDNLMLHLLNVILVFFFIRLLTKKLDISIIVALFFGIHPMHVESVAWISERKDVLYAFFFLSGLITYIRSQKLEVRSQKNKYLIFTFILFILSLLSKSAAVSFPVVLVLIDYYLIGFKFQVSSFKFQFNKLPFFILSIIFGIIAIHFQSIGEKAGDMIDLSHYSIFDRIVLDCYSAAFYIVKLFIPSGLCASHFYPVKLSGMFPIECYLSVALILGIVISIILIKLAQLKKDLIFGTLFFLSTIVFFLKIVPSVGFVITGERFSYIPYTGLVFATGRICLGITENKKLITHNTKLKTQILIALLVITSVIYSIMTYERNKVWTNSLSLYNDVLEKNPGATSQIINRGMTKCNLGDFSGAIEDFDRVIENSPQNAKAFFCRALAKSKLGNKKSAIEDYSRVIEINPTLTAAYYSRGMAKSESGDKIGAIEDFNKDIEINPNHSDAFISRGNAKGSIGDKYGALFDFNKAIELNPQNSQVYNNRGTIKAYLGNMEEAVKDFDKAIELNPQYGNAYNNRGSARYITGDKDGGCSDWKKAAELGVRKANQMIIKNCQ
jgi:protein O-mannosyl-transferase